MSSQDAQVDSNYDPELVSDFMEALNEAGGAIDSVLLRQEEEPSNKELLNELFRNLHSIKSNLRMMGLNRASDFVHTLENVIEELRNGNLKFENSLSDVVLLSINRIIEISEETFSGKPTEHLETSEIEAAMKNILQGGQENLQIRAKKVIQLLDPEFSTESFELQEIPTEASDLEMFNDLGELVESRSPNWIGRVQRTLTLAQNMALTKSMDEDVKNQVDLQQLKAAIYMHDVGIAFLPLDLLHKKDKLNDKERERMEHHPVIGSDLLRQLDGWDEAATMVLQHHEREDSKGYPNGLSGDSICAGAKIIAIADMFESLTRERADRVKRDSLLRTFTEINGCAGSQFSPVWVKVFNIVIRKAHVKVK